MFVPLPSNNQIIIRLQRCDPIQQYVATLNLLDESRNKSIITSFTCHNSYLYYIHGLACVADFYFIVEIGFAVY